MFCPWISFPIRPMYGQWGCSSFSMNVQVHSSAWTNRTLAFSSNVSSPHHLGPEVSNEANKRATQKCVCDPTYSCFAISNQWRWIWSINVRIIPRTNIIIWYVFEYKTILTISIIVRTRFVHPMCVVKWSYFLPPPVCRAIHSKECRDAERLKHTCLTVNGGGGKGSRQSLIIFPVNIYFLICSPRTPLIIPVGFPRWQAQGLEGANWWAAWKRRNRRCVHDNNFERKEKRFMCLFGQFVVWGRRKGKQ